MRLKQIKILSSYVLTRSGDGKDSIAFRRVEYHANGSFSSVQEIAWFLRDNTLWRSCQTLKGAATTACPNDANPPRVIMAENVDMFSLTSRDSRRRPRYAIP